MVHELHKRLFILAYSVIASAENKYRPFKHSTSLTELRFGNSVPTLLGVTCTVTPRSKLRHSYTIFDEAQC